VFNLLNVLPVRFQPYAKAVVAAIGALAGVAVFYFGDQPAVAAVIQVLTVLGVYAQPNAAE
jgi:hypothetical protein